MNKLLNTLILSVLVTTSLLAVEITINETKKQLKGDPYKVVKWIIQNMKVTNDSIGFGQPPERTFKYKKGDCEDIAILVQYFLKDKYEVHIVVWAGEFREDSKYYKQYKGRKICHAVAAFKINENNWGIIDQDRFMQHGKTLAEIVKINCDLRRIKVKEAYIMDLLKLRRKKIKEIDLGE